MSLGGLAVLFGAVWQPLGQIFAYAVWPFVSYTIRVVEWFAGWEGGVRVVGGFSLWMLIGFYFLLAAVTLYWRPLVERLKSSLKPALVISALLVAAFLVW